MTGVSWISPKAIELRDDPILPSVTMHLPRGQTAANGNRNGMAFVQSASYSAMHSNMVHTNGYFDDIFGQPVDESGDTYACDESNSLYAVGDEMPDYSGVMKPRFSPGLGLPSESDVVDGDAADLLDYVHSQSPSTKVAAPRISSLVPERWRSVCRPLQSVHRQPVSMAPALATQSNGASFSSASTFPSGVVAHSSNMSVKRARGAARVAASARNYRVEVKAELSDDGQTGATSSNLGPSHFIKAEELCDPENQRTEEEDEPEQLPVEDDDDEMYSPHQRSAAKGKRSKRKRRARRFGRSKRTAASKRARTASSQKQFASESVEQVATRRTNRRPSAICTNNSEATCNVLQCKSEPSCSNRTEQCVIAQPVHVSENADDLDSTRAGVYQVHAGWRCVICDRFASEIVGRRNYCVTPERYRLIYYGLPTCKGCQVFFRKTLMELNLKGQPYAALPCASGGRCTLLAGVGFCVACRFNRCVARFPPPDALKPQRTRAGEIAKMVLEKPVLHKVADNNDDRASPKRRACKGRARRSAAFNNDANVLLEDVDDLEPLELQSTPTLDLQSDAEIVHLAHSPSPTNSCPLNEHSQTLGQRRLYC